MTAPVYKPRRSARSLFVDVRGLRYHLLAWGAGTFELIACDVEGADRVGVSTMNLLLEGARRLDEQHREHREQAS